MNEEDEEFGRIEREAKQRDKYEHVVYSTAGFELEAGFYTVDDLRQMLKALDNMNTMLIEESK